jgi:hypothetical protein
LPAASCGCSKPEATFLIFPNSTGDAETLDEAKAAFRARAETVGPFDPRTMRLHGER